MLRGDPGSRGQPRSQTRSEPPAAPPYPPLQSRRRLQLHAGTSLRTDPAEGWVWGQELEDQFLCFSPPARTRPGWTGLRSVLSKAWEPDEEWLGDRK